MVKSKEVKVIKKIEIKEQEKDGVGPENLN